MNKSELFIKISSGGLIPIQVEDTTDKEESEGLSFVGTFDEFIKAALSLDEKVIFVSIRKLEENDFEGEIKFNFSDEIDYSEIEIRQEIESEYESVNFLEISSSFKKYKEYLEKECVYKLSIKSLKAQINFYIEEDWWTKLEEEKMKTIEKIYDRKLIKAKEKFSELSKLSKEKKDKEQRILDKLKKLINDPYFSTLPTQKAMLAYAEEKIKDLNELDPVLIKKEIQEMKAKIVAKAY